MPQALPHLDILTQAPETPGPVAGLRSPRLVLFLGVLGLTLAVGQTLNLLRPPIYRATATLLTVAPPKVDEKTRQEDLDFQHQQIQRQAFLGQGVLQETLRRLTEAGEAARHGLHSPADLQGLLAVTPVPTTHLLELRAQGPQRDLLAPLVNAWADAYVAHREQAVHQEVGGTLDALRDQYQQLGQRLEQQRAALTAFRDRHGILSQGRNENWAHARLQGLTDAVNKAREAATQAEANLRAKEAALARGEPVVAEEEKREILNLEVKLKKLRDREAEYEQRFTGHYRFANRELFDLPLQIAEVEKEIAHRRQEGQKLLLASLRQEIEAARQRVLDLDRQRAAHAKEAAEFTSRFTEHEALVKDLEGLEEMYRTTGQRVARIESEGREKYPQLQITEAAYYPVEAVDPHYVRDALWISAGALGLALLAVWLRDFLTRPAGVPSGGGLTGIRVYAPLPAAPAPIPTFAAPVEPQRLADSPSDAVPLRELTLREVDALLQAGSEADRQLVALLLSGLDLDELVALAAEDLDPALGRLEVRGPGARTLLLPEAVWTLFPFAQPVWHGADGVELDAQIRGLAYDAGVPRPEEVTAVTLRYTYAQFLVRQGVCLDDLEWRLGPVSAPLRAALAATASEGPGRPLEEIETTYPALLRPL